MYKKFSDLLKHVLSKKALIFLAITVLADATFFLSWGYVSKFTTDYLQYREPTFFRFAVILLGINILSENVLYPIFKTKYALSVMQQAQNLREKCMSKILYASPTWVKIHGYTDIQNRIQQNINAIQTYFQEALPGRLIQMMSGTASLVLLFFYNWQSALICLAVALFVVLLQRFAAQDAGNVAKHKAEEVSRITRLLLECYHSASTLRQALALPWMEKRIEVEVQNYTDILSQEGALGIRRAVISVFAMLVSQFGVLLFLLIFVEIGQIELSVAVMAFALQRTIGDLLDSLGKVHSEMTEQNIFYDRILDILDCKPWYYVQQRHQQETAVSLRNVYFSYDFENETLHNITVDIPTQGLTVVVGANGSGKSTLLKVLSGLYIPTSGFLYRNGNIGYMEQRNTIFDATLRENICLGKTLLDETVKDALVAADLERFAHVDMDTELSFEATKLSGGEARKLCLARLLAHNSDILVLDEPLANIDPTARNSISEIIDDLRKDHCVIIVEHMARQILPKADLVLFMDKGSLIGRGKHAWLLENIELYRTIIGAE